MDTLREIFSADFLLRDSIYISVLVGLVCPLVGVYLTLRRLIFMGVALPQISTCGIAFAFSLQAWGVIPHRFLRPRNGYYPQKELVLLGRAIVSADRPCDFDGRVECRAAGGLWLPPDATADRSSVCPEYVAVFLDCLWHWRLNRAGWILSRLQVGLSRWPY